MAKFSVSQEYGEDDDEGEELLPRILKSTGTGGASTIIIKQQSSHSNAAVWRAMTIILLGIVLLFMTDSIELKHAAKNSDSGGDGTVGGGGSGVASVYGNGDTVLKDVDEQPPVAAPVTVAASAAEDEGAQQPAPSETTPDAEDTKVTTPKEDEPKDDSAVAATEPEPTEDEVKEETTASGGESTATGSTSTSDDDWLLGSTYIGRRTYKPRGQPLTDDERKEMIDKWGSWTLVDTKDRPKEDYYMKYPNRDIPRAEFPSNAWQTDKEYLDKFLPESLNLVERALKAIYAEYGHDYPNDENGNKLFVPEFLPPFNETADDKLTPGRRGSIPRPSIKMSGWTNSKSYDGLKRRLLHAVMTEDSFIFAMGGHSAAAGHG